MQSVKLEGAYLSGATIIHNHPLQDGEQLSFGQDDFNVMKDNPDIARIEAQTIDYDHVAVRHDAIASITCGEAWRRGLIPGSADDQQHNVMEWLNDSGYISYSRTRVSR